jgi:hypothetical protein
MELEIEERYACGGSDAVLGVALGPRVLEARSVTRPERGYLVMWRQRAGVTELGLASQPDFWARVDALGERKYYARVDMKGRRSS